MIQEHFCNYENSLALRELGFDRECIFGWVPKGYLKLSKPALETDFQGDNPYINYEESLPGFAAAPLFSQAIQWIRDNTDFVISTTAAPNNESNWIWSILRVRGKKHCEFSGEYESWNQCAQDAITKAVQIIKDETFKNVKI